MLLAASAAALALSGCAMTGGSATDSPLFSPPAGTVITLNKNVEVRKERSRVYIQDGELFTTIKDVEKYAPWCALEVHRGGSEFEQSFSVQSGRFDVVKSWKGIDYASLSNTQRMVAGTAGVKDDSSRDSGLIWVNPIDEDRPMETLATYMTLNSPDQPAVKVLVCGVFADSVVYNHLRLHQIRATLGDVMSLTLPQTN